MSLFSIFGSIFGRRPQSAVPPPPSTPPPPASEELAAPPTNAEFVAILEAAGVNLDQRNKVMKAQELLRNLPPEAPWSVKRNIVEAAFKAFDISTEEIVVAASSEVEALTAYIRRGEEEKQRSLAEGEQRIAELESKIAEVKATMARAMAEQEARARATRDEVLRVQPVLQFFAREPITRDSPETGEKSAPPAPGNGIQADSVDIQWESGRDAP
jgi:hypothetical protein